MRNLKLLNRKYFSIILIFLFIAFSAKSEEDPVDIWSLKKKETSETNIIIENKQEETPSTNKIYEMQSEKKR